MNASGAKRMLKDWGLVLAMLAAFYVAADWVMRPALPDIAPDFSLASVSGEQVNLSSLRGKTVVLNFWATWCGPCRTEIPELVSFQAAHPDVALLGIALDSGGASKLNAWLSRRDLNYPILIGTSAVQSAYDVSTLPTTIIVEPSGRIGRVFVGGLTEQILNRALNSVPPTG